MKAATILFVVLVVLEITPYYACRYLESKTKHKIVSYHSMLPSYLPVAASCMQETNLTGCLCNKLLMVQKSQESADLGGFFGSIN